MSARKRIECKWCVPLCSMTMRQVMISVNGDWTVAAFMLTTRVSIKDHTDDEIEFLVED